VCTNVIEVLMKRDNCTEEEAYNQVYAVGKIINDAFDEHNWDDAFYACGEIGLEPDYLLEILYITQDAAEDE